jgi:Ion channel
MNFDRGGRFRALQEQYSDPLLTLLTVLLLLLMFVVAPLQAAGMMAFQAFGVFVAAVMIGGVLVISGSTVAASVMLIAFSLNVVVIILRLRNEPSVYDLYFVAVAWLTLSMILGWAVARAVFAPGRVSYHRIVGAVLLYLLIALTFVALYLFVGLLIPKAFSGLVFEDDAALASGIIYFSFVTLTTVGYGDILPVHPVARSLCNLESIFGQLYPATLLARLVTLEIEGRRK